MSGTTLWRSLADGRRSGPAVSFFKLAFAPCALCYSVILALRAICYRRGILHSQRLPRPVISVGNLTAGGTGKTPVTAWIARYLLARGTKVVVLSRGYGGSLEGKTAVVSDGRTLFLSPAQCGDEPYLLASTVPGLAVVIGADRYRAGLLAMEQLQPDLFLLDDGYQHLALQRDLNILLLDAANPFGNGWCLPAGLLREPQTAVRRADLVIFTRWEVGRGTLPVPAPSCRVGHRLGSLYRLTDQTTVSLAHVRESATTACAGIADPAGFFAALQQLGITLQSPLSLPDHEPYHAGTVTRIAGLLASTGARWLLTTEKDAVKLWGSAAPWLQQVVVVPLELAFDDEEPLLVELERRFPCRPC